jgi:hypothetical protein
MLIIIRIYWRHCLIALFASGVPDLEIENFAIDLNFPLAERGAAGGRIIGAIVVVDPTAEKGGFANAVAREGRFSEGCS